MSMNIPIFSRGAIKQTAQQPQPSIGNTQSSLSSRTSNDRPYETAQGTYWPPRKNQEMCAYRLTFLLLSAF